MHFCNYYMYMLGVSSVCETIIIEMCATVCGKYKYAKYNACSVKEHQSYGY